MIENNIWLESALESFDVALSQGNFSLAKDIIADTEDAGYKDAATALTSRLKAAM